MIASLMHMDDPSIKVATAPLSLRGERRSNRSAVDLAKLMIPSSIRVDAPSTNLVTSLL
jgi:hypothetical protein